MLFDSLFPFALKFDFVKGESYFFKGKAEKRTLTYFWELPDIVVRFINQLTITGLHHNFIYHVVTFGTTSPYIMKETKPFVSTSSQYEAYRVPTSKVRCNHHLPWFAQADDHSVEVLSDCSF